MSDQLSSENVIERIQSEEEVVVGNVVSLGHSIEELEKHRAVALHAKTAFDHAIAVASGVESAGSHKLSARLQKAREACSLVYSRDSVGPYFSDKEVDSAVELFKKLTQLSKQG